MALKSILLLIGIWTLFGTCENQQMPLVRSSMPLLRSSGFTMVNPDHYKKGNPDLYKKRANKGRKFKKVTMKGPQVYTMLLNIFFLLLLTILHSCTRIRVKTNIDDSTPSKITIEVSGFFVRNVNAEEANVYGANESHISNLVRIPGLVDPKEIYIIDRYPGAQYYPPLQLFLNPVEGKLIHLEERVVAVNSGGYVKKNESTFSEPDSLTQCVFNEYIHKWNTDGVVPAVDITYSVNYDGIEFDYQNQFGKKLEKVHRNKLIGSQNKKLTEGEIMVSTLYTKVTIVELAIKYSSYLIGRIVVIDDLKRILYYSIKDVFEGRFYNGSLIIKSTTEKIRFAIHSKAQVKSQIFQIKKAPFVIKK